MSGIGRVFKRTWKRPDGTKATSRYYSVGFPFHGHERVEKALGAQTEAEARKFLRRRLEQIGRSEYSPGKAPSVREAAHTWLEGRRIAESRTGGAIKESTIEHWANHIHHYIIPVLGDERCDRVDTRMVEKARDIWKEMGAGSGKSVNKILVTLQAVFKKEIGLGTLRFNPVAAAERLARWSNEVTADTDSEGRFAVHDGEVYNPGELRDLLAGAKPGFDEAFLTTLALTMLRRGEALALMWQDVDFEAKEITIRRSWSGRYREGQPVFWTPKTKHGIRKVPIDDRLIGLLKRWKLQNGPGTHDLVFARSNGLPYSQSAAWHALSNSCRASGVRKLTIHALRHTGASIHLMMGTPLPEVSAMLGHANINVTLAVYTHFIPQMRSDSASKLSEMVFGSSESTSKHNL